MPAFDLFLSHNSDDKPAVREIARALRKRRFNPWLDADELTPGRSWQDLAEEAIGTCRAAAVFVGPNGIGPWEHEEMRACLGQAVKRGLAVIPVLLPGAPKQSDLPLFLGQRTWVDLRTTGITPAGLDLLVWGITGKKPKARARVQPSPPPPIGPPPIHNLPYPPLGDLLKGRDDELTKLAESLQGNGHPTAIIQGHRTLYGLGGIGKTRLAVEYAWRLGARYKAALFVRAESSETLNNGLAALASIDLLDLPERTAQSQDETIQAVRRWLKANANWLLILDNVDSKEAESEVVKILPALAGGHILITSRLRDWPKTIHKQALDTISLDEARSFLLKRTEGERTADNDDEAQAGHLAEKLDGLPLALEQAGAYIAHTRLSFSAYLKIWDQEKERVLVWHDEAAMGYPASVATTWKTSFDRLQPTAATLLRLSAFLAPEPIPQEMFESEMRRVQEAVEMLRAETGQEAGPGSIPEALAELESYSLISRQGGAFSVHRVVQEVMQNRTPPEERAKWIEAASKIVDDYSPDRPSDVRTWPIWNVLSPHAARVALTADTVGLAEPTGRLMGQLALYLVTRGLYSEAEPLMWRSLAIGEASSGNNHPNVAIRLNNLAHLLQTTNRLSEAEPLVARVVTIFESSLGKDHPNVALALNHHAQLLQSTHRLTEAEPLMRRALAIDEMNLGPQHPNVAIRLNNLAQLLKDTTRLTEAEPLMERVVIIFESSLGEKHPNVGVALNNLALLFKDTNRLSEAEPLMRRALAIDEASLGPQHPKVAIRLNNLAQLLKDTNRLTEAVPMMRRALGIKEQSLGADHPSTQLSQRNLAFLLAKIEGAADK